MRHSPIRVLLHVALLLGAAVFIVRHLHMRSFWIPMSIVTALLWLAYELGRRTGRADAARRTPGAS